MRARTDASEVKIQAAIDKVLAEKNIHFWTIAELVSSLAGTILGIAALYFGVANRSIAVGSLATLALASCTFAILADIASIRQPYKTQDYYQHWQPESR
jgi:hypothetical protein